MTGSSSQAISAEERLRSGDSSALADLFNTYRPRLEKLLRLRLAGPLADRIDAADLLQEIFLDARYEAGAYAADPQVSAYIWIRGLVIDRISKIADESMTKPAPFYIPRQGMNGDNAPRPEGVTSELQERIAAVLQKLEEEDREVLLMRHFEGLSNREVADACGLGISGATLLHGRALFRLKELLKCEV